MNKILILSFYYPIQFIMETLVNLGIFFAGLGVLLAGLAFMWWCSLYQQFKSVKQ